MKYSKLPYVKPVVGSSSHLQRKMNQLVFLFFSSSILMYMKINNINVFWGIFLRLERNKYCSTFMINIENKWCMI